MKLNITKIIYGALILVVSMLVGCGGGGGGSTTPGGGTPAPSASTLTGTAAAGVPLGYATITIKDSTGAQVTTTTDAAGNYSLSTTRLTPPYLVRVTAGVIPNYPIGTMFFSVSADASPSMVNITPLTDLAVRSWYQSQIPPLTADMAFADPVAYPSPQPGVVAVIEFVVRQTVGNLLNSQVADLATRLNLISTPFTANGTGVDAVLDSIQVNAASGTVAAGSLTTSVSAASGVISTTAVSGVASTSTSVPIPTNAQASAITGIQAAMDTFAAFVNAKGALLADTDILPYLDANAMDGGFTRVQTAVEFANVRAQTAGDTVSMKVVSLDSLAGNIAHVTTLYTKTVNGKPSSQFAPFVFIQQTNGQWLLAGDMQIAQTGVYTEVQTQNAAGSTYIGLTTYVNMLNPGTTQLPGCTSTITSACPTISGPGVAPNTLLRWYGTRQDTYYGGPGNTLPMVVTYDTYGGPIPIAASLAGNTYTISIPTANGPVSYNYTMRASTDEMIGITNLTAGLGMPGAVAGGANLGSPITVNWTLPTTFTVIGVQFEGATVNGTTKCPPIGSPQLLPATATSGTITLPSTCVGVATGAFVGVAVYGANGETTRYGFNF